MKLKITFCVCARRIVAIFALADDFKTGNLYIPGPFKLIFGSGASDDVQLSKSAASTLSLVGALSTDSNITTTGATNSIVNAALTVLVDPRANLGINDSGHRRIDD
jgi:hypothetical protein